MIFLELYDENDVLVDALTFHIEGMVDYTARQPVF